MMRAIISGLGLLLPLLAHSPVAAAVKDPWTHVRAATRLQLQRQPGLSPKALRAALIRRDAGLAVQVMRLDPRSLLVALQRQDDGEVFVVSHRAGKAQIAWSAVLDAARDRPPLDPLQAWRLDANSSAEGAARGRLSATLIALPSGRGDERRFAIDAVQAQALGAAAPAQLSVWRWTGQTARPLLVVPYTQLLAQPAPIILTGDVLRIQQKAEFKTFIACGACAERRMVRTVALTDRGAEDRGAVDLDPDLALVDAILDHSLRGRRDPRVDRLVVAQLRPRLKQIEAEGAGGPVLGALMGWSLSRGRVGRTLCLATDQTGAMRFSLRGRGSAARVTAVRLTDDAECEAA